MNKKSNFYVLYVAQSAIIAAIYVVLTLVGASFSYGEVQVRISEALTILPMFTPAAIPGLFVGCFLANLAGQAVLLDVIFGSLTTLAAAYLTWTLRNRSKYIAVLPPIVLNALIIPFVLRYGSGLPFPIPFMMLTVGLGEVISCGVLGLLLHKVLSMHRQALFPRR